MERLPADDRALNVARRVAGELVASEGARAVVVVGSHARGDAGPLSDLDLMAVGDEPSPPRLRVVEQTLVSVSVQPMALHRESFETPGLLCGSVPGWRDALVLHDPDGLAASLVGEARRWTWGPVERRCDVWVAEEVTARAETVHKLVGSLQNGHSPVAAAKRDLLVARLTAALAVHRRILYGGEGRMWDLVPRAMGEGWREAQDAATGLAGCGFEETCRSALRLYEISAREVRGLLDERQTAVVKRAEAIVGGAW